MVRISRVSLSCLPCMSALPAMPPPTHVLCLGAPTQLVPIMHSSLASHEEEVCHRFCCRRLARLTVHLASQSRQLPLTRTTKPTFASLGSLTSFLPYSTRYLPDFSGPRASLKDGWWLDLQAFVNLHNICRHTQYVALSSCSSSSPSSWVPPIDL
jgi:hypothetical protein